MRKVFIIGGMGAGKSTVAHALESLGVPRIDLDEIAREVLEDEKTRAGLAAVFGADVLEADGALDRSLVARRAFASPEGLRALNDLTQPRIYQRYRARLRALEAAGVRDVVVEYPLYPQERALYVEPGDEIVAVEAPRDERVARAVAAGFDEADVRRRIAAQASDEERARDADVVFENDATADALAERVRAWWRSRASDGRAAAASANSDS